MVRIITACSQGLVRSVGLADVLKLHFEPVDVIPIGVNSNPSETIMMLGQWCRWFVVMEDRYRARAPDGIDPSKILVCEVGKDVYGSSHHPGLIDKCWRWCRANQALLGITEHHRKI